MSAHIQLPTTFNGRRETARYVRSPACRFSSFRSSPGLQDTRDSSHRTRNAIALRPHPPRRTSPSFFFIFLVLNRPPSARPPPAPFRRNTLRVWFAQKLPFMRACSHDTVCRKIESGTVSPVKFCIFIILHYFHSFPTRAGVAVVALVFIEVFDTDRSVYRKSGPRAASPVSSVVEKQNALRVCVQKVKTFKN